MKSFERKLAVVLGIVGMLAGGMPFTRSSCAWGADQADTLLWAADTESGAPFAFADPHNPTQLIGFEAEIIQAVGKKLGLNPVFVQNSWDGLIPGLQSGNYAIAINGIEITEDRQKEVLFSIPYYVTSQQLVVRANQSGLQQLSDLKGRKTGTLKVSLAERMLNAEGGIEVLSYDSEVQAYEDLANGRTDAVLLDAPIAVYYAQPNANLKLVGPPIGQMSYGIVVAKKDTVLHAKINAALQELIASGELRTILERWNLWNPLLAAQWDDHRPSRTSPVMYEQFLQSTGHVVTWEQRLERYRRFVPALIKGAGMTLMISVLAMMVAVALGLVFALTRLYGPCGLSQLVFVVIEVTRGTPLLIQLLFIFYALPGIGIKLSPLLAAIVGLGLNYAAYEAENYRAGILSVPKGQMEAARALGMSRFEALRHVILPQALRLVIPPITNDFISLLKDSSLVSVITMVELTKVYNQLASTHFDYFGTGLMVAAIYLLIGLPFIRLARHFEKKHIHA